LARVLLSNSDQEYSSKHHDGGDHKTAERNELVESVFESEVA